MFKLVVLSVREQEYTRKDGGIVHGYSVYVQLQNGDVAKVWSKKMYKPGDNITFDLGVSKDGTLYARPVGI
ncbi:MAG: hypothetical protein RR232_01030 [Clostridia bacterium]